LAGIGPVWRAGGITPLAVSATEIDLKQRQDCKTEVLIARGISGLVGSSRQGAPLT